MTSSSGDKFNLKSLKNCKKTNFFQGVPQVQKCAMVIIHGYRVKLIWTPFIQIIGEKILKNGKNLTFPCPHEENARWKSITCAKMFQ